MNISPLVFYVEQSAVRISTYLSSENSCNVKTHLFRSAAVDPCRQADLPRVSPI